MNNSASTVTNHLPRLIAWEVTRSCNLNCKHCRAAAHLGPYSGEFSTDECKKVLDNVASFCKPIMILTGGEPMLRSDIYEIARYGTDLGLTMVMAPCGSMVTQDAARKMLDNGIRRISLSIDGATAQTHDAFRQVDGAFDSVVQAARNAKAVGLDFQINTTVTRQNLHELEQILDLALSLGAAAYHPFLLVPTGRGKELADQELSPEEYERVLNWIHKKSKGLAIPFKPTCAPHYYRIALQREKTERAASPANANAEQAASPANSPANKPQASLPVANKSAAGHPAHIPGGPAASHHPGMQSMSKGCMGGQSFAFISHTGKIQICGFLETECGDLRASNYDFQNIWNTSNVFLAMRDLDSYHGRCGFCEYRRVCGGCRARAYAMTGDYLAEEPFCVYTPQTKGKNR